MSFAAREGLVEAETKQQNGTHRVCRQSGTGGTTLKEVLYKGRESGLSEYFRVKEIDSNRMVNYLATPL